MGDDVSFGLVVHRIEHAVLDALAFEQFAEVFGLLDGDSTDQHWLAVAVALGNIVDHRVELLPLALVDHVRVVEADHRLIGWDHHHVEIIDLLELYGLGIGGAGHARQFFVHAEVVLNRDSGQGLVFLADADLLFGLNCLVETVRPAPAGHEPASELVNNENLPLLDHIIHIALEQGIRFERLVNVVEGADLGRVVEVFDP